MKTIKTFRELSESVNITKLSKDIDKVLIKYDENLGVEDFAKAIAKILKEEYGEHNYDKFIKTLKENI